MVVRYTRITPTNRRLFLLSSDCGNKSPVIILSIQPSHPLLMEVNKKHLWLSIRLLCNTTYLPTYFWRPTLSLLFYQPALLLLIEIGGMRDLLPCFFGFWRWVTYRLSRYILYVLPTEYELWTYARDYLSLRPPTCLDYTIPVYHIIYSHAIKADYNPFRRGGAFRQWVEAWATTTRTRSMHILDQDVFHHQPLSLD